MSMTRRSMWLIFPGLVFYNLVGRHLLWRRVRRQLIAEGRNPKDFGGRPGWIRPADVKALPRATYEDRE
jgi:hypothetical protein